MKKTFLIPLLLGSLLGANAAFGQGLELKLDHRMELGPELGAERVAPLGKGTAPVWLKLNWNSPDISRIGKISPIDRVLLRARQKLIDPEQAKPLSSFKIAATAAKNHAKSVKLIVTAVKNQKLAAEPRAMPPASGKASVATSLKTAAPSIAGIATTAAAAPASLKAQPAAAQAEAIAQNKPVLKNNPELRGMLLGLPVLAFCLFVAWPVIRQHLQQSRRMNVTAQNDNASGMNAARLESADDEAALENLTVLVLSAGPPVPVNSLDLHEACIPRPAIVESPTPVAAVQAAATVPVAKTPDMENLLADFDAGRYPSMDEFLAARHAITREQIMAWSRGGSANNRNFAIAAASRAA